MDMLEVIVKGAETAARHEKPPAAPQAPSNPSGRSTKFTAPTAPCPFCGSEPPLATRRHGRFLVGCESDDCHVNPQVSGASLNEAWARWNRRPDKHSDKR